MAKKQSFLHGAAILAAAVAVVKVLGFIAKIPLINILGGTGNGYYNVAYSVYNVLLILSTAGLPVAVSKLVAESVALGRGGEVRRIVRGGLGMFLIVGTAATVLMFIFAPQLAGLMRSSGSVYTIQAIAPAVLCVSVMSVFRGYYQGMTNMYPTAVSQIIEAAGKLAIGVGVAWWLSAQGTDVRIVAAGAVAGMTLGEVFAMLYMLLRYLFEKKRDRGGAEGGRSYGEICKAILAIAIPITIGSGVLALTNFIDTALVMRRLQDAAGFTEERATWLFGSYGMAQTMFNFPSAFIVPLAVSVVPAISTALARRDNAGVTSTMEQAVRITSILALPAAAGLSVLAGPILGLLWGSTRGEEVIAATTPLSILGIAVFFNCVVLLTNSILQSFGKVRIPVYTMLAGAVVKITINWFLVGVPEININGAPIGTCACYFTIMALNLFFIARNVKQAPSVRKMFGRPLIATLVMATCAWAVNGLLVRFVSGRIAVVGAIAVAGVVYLVLVIALRAITREDLKLLPKGEKLADLLRIR